MFDNLRLIDLSVPLEHQAISEPLLGKIHYVRHAGEGLQQMQHFRHRRRYVYRQLLDAMRLKPVHFLLGDHRPT